MSDKPKCLNPDCGKDAAVRGLCRVCYPIATRLVKTGAKTWEGLISEGKASPPATRGPKRVGARAAWLMGQPVATV